jgi:hypothetical protein
MFGIDRRLHHWNRDSRPVVKKLFLVKTPDSSSNPEIREVDALGIYK